MDLKDNGRDQRGRWRKGFGGRPVGAKGKNRAHLEAIKAMAPEAIMQLRNGVATGEKWAIELVLTHVLPTGRTIEFEDLEAADIAEAIANGDISPGEARDIVFAMSKVAEFSAVEPINKTIDIDVLKTDSIEDAANKYKFLIEDEK